MLVGAAMAALPVLGAATLAAGPASATPAAQVAVARSIPAVTNPCGSGNSDPKYATLKYGGGGDYGTIFLCYNSTSRDVWAIVESGIGACQSDNVGCGSALIHNNNTGAQKTCNIAVGHTSCTTGEIGDANTTSYAQGDVILDSNGQRVARGTTGNW